MIEDVKWLKPDDYIKKHPFGYTCWLTSGGSVFFGYMCMDKYRKSIFVYIDKSTQKTVQVCPDGVCQREKNQQPPVLR